MRIINDLNSIPSIKNPVVTTGTFDGVHVGHRKIIQRLKKIAERTGGETVLVTFHPHPRLVLFPETADVKLLTTKSEKLLLLEQAGIDNVVIIPFTREFSNYTSGEYISKILVEKLHTHYLVTGYDHHFGKNRAGSFEDLLNAGKQNGFEVEEIPAQEIEHIAISSSKIRKALQTGDILTANKFLGYDYFLSGLIIKGEQIGRKIGTPTANIALTEENKLIPEDGVYVVEAFIHGDKHQAVMNIGFRPTFEGTKHCLEVHLLNFEGEIYGEEITVVFKKRLREEMKFPSVEELKKQIHADIEDAKRFFS